MLFIEALLLFILFWLRWRRLLLARARRQRITAAQGIELAVVVLQWYLTSHFAIAAALCLLQGNRFERRVWSKPRSASFYQDIVPGWNDTGFKANFCVRHVFCVLGERVTTCSAEARALSQYHSSGSACCYCSLETRESLSLNCWTLRWKPRAVCSLMILQ